MVDILIVEDDNSTRRLLERMIILFLRLKRE